MLRLLTTCLFYTLLVPRWLLAGYAAIVLAAISLFDLGLRRLRPHGPTRFLEHVPGETTSQLPTICNVSPRVSTTLPFLVDTHSARA